MADWNLLKKPAGTNIATYYGSYVANAEEKSYCVVTLYKAGGRNRVGVFVNKTFKPLNLVNLKGEICEKSK